MVNNESLHSKLNIEFPVVLRLCGGDIEARKIAQWLTTNHCTVNSTLKVQPNDEKNGVFNTFVLRQQLQ